MASPVYPDSYVAGPSAAPGGPARSTALHEPPPGPPRVPEALVQDVWRFQRFNRAALVTTRGEPVVVLHPGVPNADAGPDFLDAHLRVGPVAWRGAVEIHVTSSGWVEHRHHLDARYNSTVLHVTLYTDLWTGKLLRADGSLVPECVLNPRLDAPLRHLLHQFYTQPAPALPCAAGWARVPEALRRSWIETLARERLREKTRRLAERYLRVPDLEALLHERLFAGLGYAKNTEAMVSLARRLPLHVVRDLSDPLDVEAVHLGVAGLLPTPAELLEANRGTADYVMHLRERFEPFRHAWGLPVMTPTAWRFFRLRPANFPPLRVAQAATLVAPGGLLAQDPVGRLVEATRTERPVEGLRTLLRARPGPFWNTHVRLEKATKPRTPAVGTSRCDALLVNAVLPVLLLHAELTGDRPLEQAAWAMLRRLPAEQDEVARRFRELGTRPRHALDTQGLHQLYRTRCAQGGCLSCPIGQALLETAGLP